MAKHEIFILSSWHAGKQGITGIFKPFQAISSHGSRCRGFFLSPHIDLVREGPPLATDSKVSSLLKAAADRGVRVYVLLYHETMNLVPNDSERPGGIESPAP